jgi:hypothetical protein
MKNSHMLSHPTAQESDPIRDILYYLSTEVNATRCGYIGWYIKRL